MKLGCGTVLFNQLDLYGALQHIAWAGYDGAELACMANIAQHIELNTDQSYIDDVKSMARKHGLELFAIQAGFGVQSEEEKLKMMTKLFDVAVKLSIPVVTARSEGKSGDKEATEREFKYFSKLGKEAESRGIILAIKAHAGSSVYNTATLIQTVDEIDSPGLRANFDPLHLFISGDDPLEAVLRLGKRTVYTHFHDIRNRDQSPANPEKQIPGRGKIDWLQILKHLRNLGYDKTVNTQIMGASVYPLSRQMGIAAEARGYLNRCLQELK